MSMFRWFMMSTIASTSPRSFIVPSGSRVPWFPLMFWVTIVRLKSAQDLLRGCMLFGFGASGVGAPAGYGPGGIVLSRFSSSRCLPAWFLLIHRACCIAVLLFSTSSEFRTPPSW